MGRSEAAREVLQRRREELESTIAGIQRDERSETASGETDNAQEWEEAEIREAELQSTRRELADVEAALGRLDRGEYGVCERCGSRIADDRLTLLPATALCAVCAKD